MFVFVTLGDGTYLLSIILYRTDLLFIVQKLPWSVGSAWSFFVDLVVSHGVVGGQTSQDSINLINAVYNFLYLFNFFNQIIITLL